MILSGAPALNLSLALATTLGYALQAALATRLGPHTARKALLAAWGLHAVLLALHLLGEESRFGFAPALSVTAWLVVAVYAIDSRLFPQRRARQVLAIVGALAVGLAWVFPGAPLHRAASAWLPLHWALGIASYGLFAAAVVHAWIMVRAERDIRKAASADSGLPLLTLERLTFRFVMAGFVLLSATLLAGLLFSEQLYGATGAWRWDHKTVFSVLSWAAFAVLLVGRARFGWRGRKAVRILYFGSLLLLLAYVGSRFVIEVVLGRGA